MSDASYLAGAARTPIGRFGGSLARLSAPDLGVHAATAALERAGLAPEQRRYTPHITLARLRAARPNAVAAYSAMLFSICEGRCYRLDEYQALLSTSGLAVEANVPTVPANGCLLQGKRT